MNPFVKADWKPKPLFDIQTPRTTTPQPTKQRGKGGTATSLISEGGALGGAALGAAAGSVVPVVGTAIGGIIGAGLGAFGGRLAENKVRDDEYRVGDAAKEGAMSAVLAGPLKALKYGGTAAKGLKAGKGLEGALIDAAEKSVAPGLLKRGLSKVGEKATQRASNRFLEVTPQTMQRLLDEGVNPQELISKWGQQLGTSYDDMIKNAGKYIKEAEGAITSTSQTTGKNIRIDGSDIIKQLKSQSKVIKNELGGETRYNQMQKIIADAERKYKNGVTVKQARDILREANQRFGASVLDDTGDAVARAAQKLEANVLRDALKSRFPTIAGSLDNQSELITLRELLKRGRAVNMSKKGANVGRIDLTRPGTLVDALTGVPAVSRRIAGASTPSNTQGAARPLVTGLRRGAQGVLGESLFGGNQSVNSSISQNMTANEMKTPMTTSTVDMGIQSQTFGDLSSGMGQPQSYYSLESAIMDVQRDPQNADYYMQLYEFANPEPSKASQPKPLNQAQQERADLINALTMTEDAVDAGSINYGPIGSRVEGVKSMFNAADPETLSFKNTVSGLRAAITKARAGASLTAGELKLLEKYTPSDTDSEQVVRSKLAQLRALYGNSAPTQGAGTLEDALMQFQYSQ